MEQHIRKCLWLAALLTAFGTKAQAKTDQVLNPTVISWLEAQTNIQT